jgi:hypothetical protein
MSPHLVLAIPLGVVGRLVDCVSRVTVPDRNVGASTYGFSSGRIGVHARPIGSADTRVMMNSDAPCHVSIGCVMATDIVGVTVVPRARPDGSRAITFDTSSICYAMMSLD